MAERLTEKVLLKKLVNGYYGDIDVYQKSYIKLGMLEDIMEKYGIESVEELDYLLEVFKKMRKQYGKLNQENCKSKKDRDTWKRACELASETLKQVMGKPLWIGGNIPTPEVKDNDYFYQQAKKEQDENKN